MASAFDYREMAHECLAEAARTTDAARKKTLLGLAKLYHQTALTLEMKHVPPVRVGDDLSA